MRDRDKRLHGGECKAGTKDAFETIRGQINAGVMKEWASEGIEVRRIRMGIRRAGDSGDKSEDFKIFNQST